ncbi:MAG TPA: YceD family protein [Caulobacteraceae bacterium]|jgi:uncharacterized metal-binding protein YceD (DUF177 family)|nr:YceD family protein [Caulobacteraceae bacterium]
MSRIVDWSVPVRLSDVGRGPEARRLEPDEAQRKQIAAALGLAGLPAFSGEIRLVPWHDGAEIHGRWTAKVTYACGLTLEPFDEDLEGDFTVRAVPPSSPLAAEDEAAEAELDLDPEADDPPDVLEGEALDLAGYLIEDLSLSLDPFPRKPGAVFEPPNLGEPESPFAVLKRLKE